MTLVGLCKQQPLWCGLSPRDLSIKADMTSEIFPIRRTEETLKFLIDVGAVQVFLEPAAGGH